MTTNKRLLEADELKKWAAEQLDYWESRDDVPNSAGIIAIKDLIIAINSGTFDAQPAEVNAEELEKAADLLDGECYCGSKESSEGTCDYCKASSCVRLAAARPTSQWIPVSEWKIKCGQHVFVSYLNPLGKRRTVKAFYAEKFSIEQSEDSDNLDYDEKTDNYYFPEGWYEVIDNWDEFSSIAIYNGTVDYVMPLPPLPTRPGEEVCE